MHSHVVLFNQPYILGNELKYVGQAIKNNQLSGNGSFTKRCQQFFENKYGFGKCLLTTSCTSALEMIALLIDIKVGDEIIMPSFTFTSTANAFMIFGAKIIFADSELTSPNIDAKKIENLITSKTKAIVIVHYAGIACDMESILELVEKYKILLIEDAAQAIDSFHIDRLENRKPLGSFGHLAAFSFHETKNICSGEGGMVVINDLYFKERAEIIWEKGTNRCSFYRGEINKYEWVDIGSSFLPSELIAAFLFGQIENLAIIQEKRVHIWKTYKKKLSQKISKYFKIPECPLYAEPNGHIFYIVCKNFDIRDKITFKLKDNGIIALFHYQSLHKSPLISKSGFLANLPQSEQFSDCLLRLPIHANMTVEDVEYICKILLELEIHS